MELVLIPVTNSKGITRMALATPDGEFIAKITHIVVDEDYRTPRPTVQATFAYIPIRPDLAKTIE